MPSACTFLMLSACFHLSCTFFLVFMLVTSSIVPPTYLYAFAHSCSPLFCALFMLVISFMPVFTSCLLLPSCLVVSLYSCFSSNHTCHFIFHLCSHLHIKLSRYSVGSFNSCSGASIYLIPAPHFITVFAALPCLHTPHVDCLFMLLITSEPSYLSGHSYFLSLYAH